LFGLALLALPLAVAPARAWFCCPPWKIEAGCNAYLRITTCPYGPGVQCGPWYNYWPLEAHFNLPAVPKYPYWPAPQVLAPGVPPFPGAAPLPGAAPPGGPAPGPMPPGNNNIPMPPNGTAGPGVVPTSFQSPVPSYWHGR
jgi:hypothetical protein